MLDDVGWKREEQTIAYPILFRPVGQEDLAAEPPFE
jgi:hypothetical protein